MIADIQSTSDVRELAVNKVGVKQVRHPIAIETPDGKTIHTVGHFDMYVTLPHYIKGTHMSRFIEILNDKDIVLGGTRFTELLYKVCDRLSADHAFVSVAFPYFVSKKAPISGAPSMMDYDVTLSGSRVDGQVNIEASILIPVTSLCPCSKEISEFGAHNQRSHITVTANLSQSLWLDDFIKLVEGEASCDLYAILKRPDEKYVTERAYNNPKFVEDVVRDIATRLLEDPRITNFTVESENFESIHNHSAYAMIQKG